MNKFAPTAATLGAYEVGVALLLCCELGYATALAGGQVVVCACVCLCLRVCF